MYQKLTPIVKMAAAVGVFALLVAALPSDTLLAQVNAVQDGVNSIDDGSNSLTVTQAVKLIINTLLFIIGALSVVMIIFGGFKYVTSSGESSAVASAKNTILYAVIGLVIAVLAFTIVNFVIGVFKDPTTGGSKPVQQAPKGVGPLPY